MPFTVEDFFDLARLLEQRPEWRAELRRLLLPDEVLSLPQTVQALAGQVQALAEEVRALAEAQRRTEEQVAALVEAQRRIEEQIAALAEAQTALTSDVQLLTKRVDSLSQDVGYLKGITLELRYRDRAPAYFRRLARRLRVLAAHELDTLLDEAVQAGKLAESEADEIMEADIVVRGRRREDEAEVYLVAEVSWGVGPHDVERAAERAALLAKTGLLTIPVVAGKVITYEAANLARWRKTWQVLDGQSISPAELPIEPDSMAH
ncbi:MAG: hypothetical protein GTN71_15520 [Anaerolineae bacterium]|nr:hypothetical protein [Anaerolineae bacterium]